MRQKKHPYLYTRNGNYYFRYRLSKATSLLLYRNEIVRSLKTTDLDKAALKCQKLYIKAKELEQLVGAMSKRKELTKEKADELVKKYFRDCYASQEIGLEMDLPLSDDDLQRELKAEIRTKQNLTNEIYAQKHSKRLEATANDILAGVEIFPSAEKLSKDSFKLPTNVDLKRDFLQKIARANAELYRIYISTLKGNFHEREILDSFFTDTAESPKQRIMTWHEMEETEKSLSILIDEYINERKCNWSPKTLKENRRVFEILEEFLDDKPIHLIKRKDMSIVIKQLSNIPKNFAKYKKFKGMSVLEAITADKGETSVSTKTAAKSWNTVKSFMSWVIKTRHLDLMIIDGLTIKDKSNLKLKRDPFSVDELQTWFSCPIYTGCHSKRFRTKPGKHVFKDALYWIPLIALYSGMRLAEIVQMEIDDLKKEKDVWYFDIVLDSNNGIVKSIKNNRPRKVPIHYQLVKRGFLEFYEERKAQDYIRVFDEIKRSSNESIEEGNYSDHFSRKFTQCLENLKLKRPELVFHSFRHNMVDALRLAQVSDINRKEIVGHAQSGMDRIYGSNDITELQKCVNKITYKIDLSHLKT